jgi:hypothetical protein
MRIPKAFRDWAIAIDHGQEVVALGMVVPGADWSLVPCDLSKQERDEFCWAAVTQAIERTHGTEVSQCSIAQSVIGANLCGPDCAGCDSSEPLSDILEIRGRLRDLIKAQVSFEDIKDEIDTNRRVICCHLDRKPDGHFIIICGYSEAAGSPRVAILDPSKKVPSGPQEHDYAQFTVAYEEGGTWDETYLTQ